MVSSTGYATNQPIEDLNLFFGRQAEISWLLEQIAQGQGLVAVYGRRHIGKTSLLHAMIDRLPSEYLAIYVDADKARAGQSGLPLSQIAEQVGRKVREHLDEPGVFPKVPSFAVVQPSFSIKDSGDAQEGALPDAPFTIAAQRSHGAQRPDRDDPLQAWQTYTDDLNAQLKGRQLVLLVDNVECVDRAWLPILLQARVPLIVASESDEPLSECLPDSARSRAPSAHSRASAVVSLPSVTLGPLSNDAAADLVKALITHKSPIDPWAVRRLLEMTSNQPYYIYLFSRTLLECCTYKSPISPPQVETAFQTILRVPIAEFIVEWESSFPREKLILSVFGGLIGHGGIATKYDIQKACSRYGYSPPLRDIAATLDGLVERDLLEGMGANSYRFRLELFRLWVHHHHSPKDIFRRGLWRFQQPGFRDLPTTLRQAFVQRRGLWLSLGAIVIVALLVGVQPSLWRNVPSRTATAQANSATRSTLQIPSETPTIVPVVSPPLRVGSPQGTAHVPQPTVALPGYDLLVMSRLERESHWQIYALNSLTGKRLHLVETNANDRTPKWSPDGSRIAFASDRDGDREIYVMDLESGQLLNLTQNEDPDWQPAWSPDGNRIAFSSHRDGDWNIYVIDADGTNLTRVTTHPESDISPTWSPDGTKLLFVSRRQVDADLFILDLEGDAEPVQLTTGQRDEYDPAWSPDGEWIAFVTQMVDQSDVFVMRADGSGPVNLTNSEYANDFQPLWTADSKRLIFVSYTAAEGDHDLFVIERDGSQFTVLIDDDNDNIAPSLRAPE